MVDEDAAIREVRNLLSKIAPHTQKDVYLSKCFSRVVSALLDARYPDALQQLCKLEQQHDSFSVTEYHRITECQRLISDLCSAGVSQPSRSDAQQESSLDIPGSRKTEILRYALIGGMTTTTLCLGLTFDHPRLILIGGFISALLLIVVILDYLFGL